MRLETLDGSIKELDISGYIRGYRIKSVTLDKKDIDYLINTNIEDLQAILRLLSLSIVEPKITSDFEPINEENRQLRDEGKDFLVKASIKYL